MSKWWIGGAPYTCENARFMTNLNKGHPHGPGQARGSVFPVPLVHSGYSLWLEHITDKKEGTEAFWLMWYDQRGAPTIPASGAMWPDQLREMIAQLSAFVDPK
ncbi:hypothetical protein BHAOGJBA_1738 [Methylobacterium hispanicum]|uniref:Uncharacterized protein n=1 Tax=Methylobacterium hispanicum TaxID=270350 RepID=A0AAV4ZJL9_9HYPH|nr:MULTISPECIES: hypothetical protein [Methylobacterium]GJD88225.1 hypothetical protein BHAOGJBA_1738 [Methylobacterium hispanicum]